MNLRPVYTLANLAEVPADLPRYAVLGFPVAHSRSPALQQAAFQARDRPAHYVRLETRPEGLPKAVEALRNLGFRGWNCTVPHKVEMAGLVDFLDPSAERAGAVNTVRVDADGLRGFSTDGSGWVVAIHECFGLAVGQLRILILGAGGSGQTLAREAAHEGCPRVAVANRSLDRAEALVDSLEERWPGRDFAAVPWNEGSLASAVVEADLVVNTTSLGLNASDPLPLPGHLLRPGVRVYDLVYRPGGTQWVRLAREQQLEAQDGLSMLLHQGSAAFTIWTGLPAPLEAMRTALGTN